MTVKVTKPQINLREKISEVDKPSGVAGEAILRSETPQEVFNYINAGRKNLVINGAMQVWQRGTSQTSITTGNKYLADRFFWKVTNAGTWTQEQSSDTPNKSFVYSWKATCTSSSSSPSQLRLLQGFEGYTWNPTGYGDNDAKDITVSFWIKSNATGQYALYLEDSGTAGHYYTAHYNINSADTWEYKTIIIPAETQVATVVRTNGQAFTISWWFGIGSSLNNVETLNAWTTGDTNYSGIGGGMTGNLASAVNNYVNITGVQLELGKVATPFEHRSYGEELALCQRYFERLGNNAEAYTVVTAFTTTAMYGDFRFSPKRADPTMSISGPASNYRVRSAGNNFILTNLGFSDADATGFSRVNCTSSGFTAGYAGWLSRAAGDTYIDADAEL